MAFLYVVLKFADAGTLLALFVGVAIMLAVLMLGVLSVVLAVLLSRSRRGK